MRYLLPVMGLGLLSLTAALASPLPLRHSRGWLQQRLTDMVACDDAYLWHEVLGGRAIHQNSMTKPPNEAWEGNFHTQQQARQAGLKMDLYDLSGRRERRHLDDARDLLDWVVRNGYDAEKGHFYLKYTTKTREWDKSFHPEFNIITVAALLRYNTYRHHSAWRAIAERVLERIVQTDSFLPDRPKNLYTSGYLALKLLDCHKHLQEDRFLQWARVVVDLADRALWDEQYGGWYLIPGKNGQPPRHTTKLTHVNANMIQACLQLYLLGQGEHYRRRGLAALQFLADHLRAPDGGWYRHTTRDGADPTAPPVIGDGGTTETGALSVYDRLAQVMVACVYAWQATRDPKYLRWVDETLEKMEKTHLTRYPVGVNYGYTQAGDYQNTWCHQWGLQAMIMLVRLWEN